jgi:hypothetical protein
MAEDPTAAPAAAASAPAFAPSPVAQDLAAAEPVAQAVASPGAAADKTAAVAALIRNGFSNGPIAQSAATWNHLNTRLPEIVAAIIKEL